MSTPDKTAADDTTDAPHTTNETLRSPNKTYIRTRPNVAAELPPPTESWRLADQPLNQGQVAALKQHAIVERVRRAYEQDRQSRSDYWLWATTQAAWNYIQQLDTPSTCPNGTLTTGVQNVRGEDGYTCSVADCGCRMAREQARAILERGEN